MAETDDPNQFSARVLSWSSPDPLSRAELAELFPRSVRPAVMAVLWAVLVVLLMALVALSFHYSRTVG